MMEEIKFMMTMKKVDIRKDHGRGDGAMNQTDVSHQEVPEYLLTKTVGGRKWRTFQR